MKRILIALAAVMLAVSMSGGVAEAAKKKKAKVVVTPATAVWYDARTWHRPWPVWSFSALHSQKDPRLEVANTAVGIGSLGAYYVIRHDGPFVHNPATAAFVLSTIGCAAVSPIVGTVMVNRPLTMREVYVGTGNCVIPFLGGWIMNAWFDRNGWK